MSACVQLLGHPKRSLEMYHQEPSFLGGGLNAMEYIAWWCMPGSIPSDLQKVCEAIESLGF